MNTSAQANVFSPGSPANRSRRLSSVHAAAVLAHPRVIWTVEQLGEMGIQGADISWLVRQQLLIRSRRGVYIRHDSWTSATPWDQARLRLDAHIEGRAKSSRCIYSHESAALLHGISVWPTPSHIHVSSASEASRARLPRDLIWTHSRVPTKDQMNIQGVQVTSLARTIADLSTELSLEAMVVVLDQARRLGLSFQEMQAYVKARAGRRGVRNLRSALALSDPLSESVGESRLRFLLWVCSMTSFRPQVEVHVKGRRFRLDLADVASRVALEFDGRAKYLLGGSVEDSLLAERARENLLIESGWRILRFRWPDLNNPEQVISRVREAMQPLNGNQPLLNEAGGW